MSKEYGIDPEALNTYETFFNIIPQFGPKHFRFIRRYPKKWPRMVLTSVGSALPRAKARIINKLKLIDKELLDCPIGSNGIPHYDGNISWIENAKIYHSHLPFDAIITRQNLDALSYVCPVEDFDEDDILFDTSSCYRVRRSAISMALAVKQLLQNANEIHFVDAHFEKMKPRHLRPLLEFIKIISQRNNSFPQKVVYHIGDTTSNNFVTHNLRSSVLKSLPPNLTLSLVRWETDQMHNRFVLTNLGGIQFGIGLDDDDNDPNQKQLDDLTPLSYKVCLEKDCKGIKYMDPNNTFFYSFTGR